MAERLARVVSAACLLAAAGCATSGPAVRDIASDFLESACAPAVADADFGAAWLAHEQRHWPVYSAMYYHSEGARAERNVLAGEMTGRRREMCGHTRSFVAVAPSVVDAMRARVAESVGVTPRATVWFVAALQWTDGSAGSFRGEDVIVFNARHDTFATTRGLAATIAHELFHDAQNVRDRGADNALTPVLRKLYREGGAVFFVQTLFPELGLGAAGIRKSEQGLARRSLSRAAADLEGLLGRRDLEWADLKRFFQGGITDIPYPAKMGYVLGAAIFAEHARRYGVEAALAVTPDAFPALARDVLERFARR